MPKKALFFHLATNEGLFLQPAINNTRLLFSIQAPFLLLLYCEGKWTECTLHFSSLVTTQSAFLFFEKKSAFTHTFILWHRESEAIWGAVSCPRIPGHADFRGQRSNLQPSDEWMATLPLEPLHSCLSLLFFLYPIWLHRNSCHLLCGILQINWFRYTVAVNLPNPLIKVAAEQCKKGCLPSSSQQHQAHFIQPASNTRHLFSNHPAAPGSLLARQPATLGSLPPATSLRRSVLLSSSSFTPFHFSLGV